MSKVYNNGKCEKLPKYICHKTYGLGCLGCKMYNYYATGYQDGKKDNEKKLKALNEILALHDKWLGNEISDFEFFTLLTEIRDKYDLLVEVLCNN